MHPVIRICCLLLAAGFLARGEPGDVGVLAAIAAAAWLQARQSPRELWQVVRRLRFLLLAIAIAYFWFTPGEPLWPEAGAWSPTREGALQGLIRVAALIVLVALVQLLMRAGDRAELIGAIRWWVRPLRLVGLDPDRLALRLVLSLETVPKLREIVAARRPDPAAGPLRRIGAFAGEVFVATLDAAEHAEPVIVDLPRLRAPAPAQWLAPAVLAGLLILV